MTQTSPREEKGIQILSEGNHIRKITKNHYEVDSQTSDKTYSVRKLNDADIWECTCPDFIFNLQRGNEDKRCKHILSCEMLLKSVQHERKVERVERPRACPRCYSTTVYKQGLRLLKNGTKRQRYGCRQCRYTFILGENGFSRVSSDPRMITEALNLFMSGMTLRKIQRHIKATHDITISHVTIYKWYRKYMAIINEYTNTLRPELSDVWSLDEMVMNVKNTRKTGKGFYDWLWTTVDPRTRYVLATEVSKKRSVEDAKAIVSKSKKLSEPSYVITDSLASYEEAIRQELDTRHTMHIKTRSLEDGFANRPVERWHNELRENTKTRRGLGNDESAQRFADANRNYHNFAREHQGLDDRTPAEMAGLDLNLGNNKIRGLIEKSVEKPSFVVQLGKRISKINVVNEKDSIKVSCKGWMDKQVWREINDILKLSGFNWLSNGKDSCWLKLLS